MTITIYAMADEQDSLAKYMPNNEIGLVTSSAHHSSTQRGTLAAQGRSPVRLEWATPVDEAWISGYFGFTNNASTSEFPIMTVYDAASDTSAIHVRATNSSTFAFARNVSGTMTNFSETLTTPSEFRTVGTAIHTMFHFRFGVSGRIAVYFDNILFYERLGDYSSLTDFNGIGIRSPNASSVHRVARLVAASAPIVRQDFDTLLPDGAGNSSDWGSNGHTRLAASGPIGLSSGIGMMNPYDPIFTNSTGQKHLSTYGNMGSVGANQKIYGVSLAAIGSIDSAATPTTIEFLARHSSTDYTLDDMNISVGDGYCSYQQFLDLNPAGGAWNTTDINAIQFGVTT
jgi:hypothetical protein